MQNLAAWILITLWSLSTMTGCTDVNNGTVANNPLHVSYGEQIFSVDDKENILVMERADGKSSVLISAEELNKASNNYVGIHRMTVYEDKLYIQVSGIEWLKFDLTTRELSQFLKDVSSGAFYEGSFYFIDHAARTFSIYKKDLQSNEITLIRGGGKTFSNDIQSSDTMYDHVIVMNEELFFTTRFPLKFYQYDDKMDVLISLPFSADLVKDLSSDDQNIYFTVESENGLQKWSYCPSTEEFN